ncbi:MAG: hypothetical protein ACOYI8_09855 [Christensenellales bacterium]|jgi:hypothetical protein
MRRTPARIAAEKLCGRVLRDRGNALYIAKGDRYALERAGFSPEEREGGILALHTPVSLFAPIPSDDDLYSLLLRDRNNPVSEEERLLLNAFVKRFEAAEPFLPIHERQLRNLSALCLRTGHGGGLWLLRMLMLDEYERSEHPCVYDGSDIPVSF